MKQGLMGRNPNQAQQNSQPINNRPAQYRNPYEFDTYDDFVDYAGEQWNRARSAPAGQSRIDAINRYRAWANQNQIGAIKQRGKDQYNRKRMQRLLGTEADEFRKNIDEYKQDRVEGLLPTYQLAEERGTRLAREDSSRRGLLYSGLGKKQESEVRSNLAQQFAQQKADINVEAESLARKKEFAAAAASLDQQMKLLGEAENYYNIAMQNQVSRRRQLAQLFGGIGYGIGAFAGMGTEGES